MVRDFSELLDAVTEAVDDDTGSTPNEADEIRQKWEDLKACVERFAIACEKGHYRLKKSAKPAGNRREQTGDVDESNSHSMWRSSVRGFSRS